MRGTSAIDARHQALLAIPAAVAFVCVGAWYGAWAVAGADIEADVDLSHAQYGAALAVTFLCMAAGHYLGGRLVDRSGARRVMPALLALFGVLLLLTPVAQGTVSFTVLFAVAGFSSGALNTAMNAAIVGREPGYFVRFHAWFNGGALVGAAALAIAHQADRDWRAAWFVIGVACVVAAPLVTRASVPGSPVLTDAEPRARLRDLIGRREIAFLAVLFLVETAVEASVDTWGVLLLRDELSVSVAFGASAFVAGQALAILARAAIGPLVGGESVRGSSTAAGIAAAGLAVMASTSNAGLAAAGLAIAVMGMSVCGPLLLARAAKGLARPAAVVGAVQAAAMAGFVVGPPLIGMIANGLGIDRAMLVLSGTAAVLAVASTSMGRADQ